MTAKLSTERAMLAQSKLRVRRIGTWDMTAEELARVWAAHHGIIGREGGWLYDAQDRNICQGWTLFARTLQRRGVIVVGKGIMWSATREVGIDRVLREAREDQRSGRGTRHASSSGYVR